MDSELTDEKTARVRELQKEIEFLLERFDAKCGPKRHFIVRMWNYGPNVPLLQLADKRMGELCALIGESHQRYFSNERRRGLGHPLFWYVAQHLNGIWCAYMIVSCFSLGRYGLMSFNVFCLAITTRWLVPPLRVALTGKWFAD